MQFIKLNTKRQLLDRVLELQEELKTLKDGYLFFKRQYDVKVIQLSDRNDTIRHLESEIKYLQQQLEHEKAAVNGYKKAYEELKEKQKSVKPINVTINQVNTDVWKVIRDEVLQKTHKCTKECFKEHVLPAIQRDYDSINPKYKDNPKTINNLLVHWEQRLSETYDFIDALFLVYGKVIVNFKK
jgi:chromosome segregation ATPase